MSEITRERLFEVGIRTDYKLLTSDEIKQILDYKDKANYRDVMIEFPWFQEITQNGSNWYDETKKKATKYIDLVNYILNKLVWASPHRDCVAGAHDNIWRTEEKSYYESCPTERMFKLWYTTLIESKVMTKNDIEKYLEEKKKKK